jgi:hypothetical protein
MSTTTTHRLPAILHELELALARAELALCHRRLQTLWARIKRARLWGDPRAAEPYHMALQALCGPLRCTYTVGQLIDAAEAALDRVAPDA